MKLTLKLLLSLGILTGGIYSATPLWLPYVLARQLPSGWQLEKLEAGYPGISGIDINVLRVKGELQAAGVAATAADIHFSYQGLKTDIGSLTIDVLLRGAEDSTADSLTFDDLSLPIAKLTGRMPELSVGQVQVVLYHAPVDSVTTQPLVLDFRAFELLPGTDNDFHLTTDVSIQGGLEAHGQVDVDISKYSRKANIRFPADVSSSPWMTMLVEQQDQALKTTTRLRATFDAEMADQQWLDRILALSTGGMLTHANGKLEVQAAFAGKELQKIEYLSLATDQLLAELNGGSLIFDAELLAKREAEKIVVTLPRSAKFEYQDTAGNIDDLLSRLAPELQRNPQPDAMAVVEIEKTSKFVIQPGRDPSLEFDGKVKLGIHSVKSSVNLQASDLKVEVVDFSDLDSTSINGELLVNWIEGEPFTYTLDDGDSAPLTIATDEMDVSAQLTLRDGKLLSTGDGIFIGGQIKPLATSAARVDVTWQELDLLNLAGELSTKTQGFVMEFDDETWTGFDFDVVYTLFSNKDINGSGTVKFNSGLDLPIEFAGNTQTEQWNITLPPTTINLAQLSSLLRVAHFELPASVKLTDGYIDLQGDVVIEDEITAKMTINGYEMGASMLESSARKASFTFNTRYGKVISVSGPVSVEALTLAGGVDVTHIRADLNLENTDTLGLKNLYAEVFDGQLSLGSSIWCWGQIVVGF